MRRLIPVLLALALAGCASIVNPLTQSRLDTINASWGATLAISANYRDACAQRLIPPSCRQIVVRIQQAAIPVQAAVQAANRASVGGQLNAVALVESASQIINDYKLLQMQYGIK